MSQALALPADPCIWWMPDSHGGGRGHLHVGPLLQRLDACPQLGPERISGIDYRPGPGWHVALVLDAWGHQRDMLRGEVAAAEALINAARLRPADPDPEPQAGPCDGAALGLDL